MTSYISERLRDMVVIRANYHCEYCLLQRDDETVYSHEVDHIIAEKHGGETAEHNLAFACFYCNRFKGTDLASIDPLSNKITPLFNPRTEVWSEHFVLDGPVIVPLSAAARATVRLLQMNRPRIVQRRTYLIRLRRYL